METWLLLTLRAARSLTQSGPRRCGLAIVPCTMRGRAPPLCMPVLFSLCEKRLLLKLELHHAYGFTSRSRVNPRELNHEPTVERFDRRL